jgi:hypothetical protein
MSLVSLNECSAGRARSKAPAFSTPPACPRCGQSAASRPRANRPPFRPPPLFAAAFAEDCESLRDDKTDKEQEKQRRKLDRELKQKQKDAERKKVKDEKRKLKEDKKNGKAGGAAGAKMKSQATLDDFRTSPENPIPVFLEKALTFIEKEGLDAEGLYRVPGNRAHVDLLFQKFDEGRRSSVALNELSTNRSLFTDNNVDIHELDIAVNAVATAVKDFFFKRLPPVLDQDHMSELETISSELP